MFAMQERFLAHQTKMQTETSSYGDASRSGVKNPPWALCVQRPSKTIKKFMLFLDKLAAQVKIVKDHRDTYCNINIIFFLEC